MKCASPPRRIDSPEYTELARAVHRVASAHLTQPQREVVLGLLRGEDTGEIATRLGISPVTVRTRLMRARAILQDELRSYLDRSGDGPPRRRRRPRIHWGAEPLVLGALVQVAMYWYMYRICAHGIRQLWNPARGLSPRWPTVSVLSTIPYCVTAAR